MWGAISRLFHKQNGKGRKSYEVSIMDRNEGKKFHDDTYGTKQAKQRATIKWLLSKAYNNRVPENLQEPFYRNHEEQEHLRPQLVHYLASAELYSMALSNIYSDPNYNNLNHGGVLQALARKGFQITDPHITETVLIQTTPIKLSAHQVVMQAVMALYAKEVATPEFVYTAVKRLLPNINLEPPQDYEHALLFWINQVTTALKLRIDKEEPGKCPEFAKVEQLQDLCDGASLAGVVSFYCPEELHWSSICVTQVPTVSDCVRNLSLVSDFCSNALPFNIFHMAPEDVYYMRGSMIHNLLVFLADLFNMLEIHPAPCVTLNSSSKATNAEGRNSHGVPHKRSLPQAVSAIPDLRSGLDTPSSFSGSPIMSSGSLKKNISNHQNDINDYRKGGDEFVVHRGRAVPTLSSVIGGNDKQAEPQTAGKPTNWEPRKPSFAGRRSRRNSLSDDSQLTLENFGGSQENLHLLGRNPDKEPAVHTGRRESVARSSVLDNNSDALHNALQETYSKQQAPEPTPRVSLSRNNSFIENHRRAEETRSSAALQETLLQPSPPLSPQPLPDKPVEKKVTTFAALPNKTTTWQQQSKANFNNEHQDNGHGNEQVENGVMGSQLMNIRLKLEERRRRIESDKRKMEAQLNRQRQQVGKAAFLQAVVKGKVVKSPDSDPGREASQTETPVIESKPARPFSLQDISEVEQKWLNNDSFVEERKTPDMDNMDIETYQQSIAQMNSSLHEIQADLQRLASQQNQLQINHEPLLLPQHTPPPQPHPQPSPQLQSFASLQQGNLSTQHINFNNQSSPNYVNQMFNNQGQYLNQPEYYNGSRQIYNNQPMQQMHSLITNNQNFNNSQQWHSLSQQQPNYNTYSPRYNQGMLQNYDDGYSNRVENQQGEFYLHEPAQTRRTWGQPYTPDPSTWNNRREPVSLSSSPKQTFLHNGSNDAGSYRTSSSPSLAATPPPRTSVHVPLPTPPVDDMEPQSISFIGTGDEEQISTGMNKLNLITSGTRTYRIPSPTRNYNPVRNSFSQQHEKPEKGFYISFDDTETPKKPKPPLRTKRNSPKKERALTQVLDTSRVNAQIEIKSPPMDTPPAPPPRTRDIEQRVPPHPIPEPIVIGNQPDPGTLDEMEKKKEKILLLSLQRRQAAEQARSDKEIEFARRRDQEKAKEEEKLRKKEEEKRRRAIILEQYKVKKAIDEAEREGKQVDKELLNSLKGMQQHILSGPGAPKLRNKLNHSTRPRPKTIHIDSGADTHDGTMTPSRGKKGSSSNLSVFASPMRRDYYRGSQDCLAETRKPSSRLNTEAGDDSRGTSPGRSLGRRSSYKTSRDPSPEVRTMGRSKYGTYQARRKSNSLMNLAGSSCDQDSLAYRYGDTDSGLGRATPPRRAPSPSGPGSLPVRRRFDDNMSDAGSDYNGPRLYKQPATKSNKSIVINAVEYCVFPGVVNKEAKTRIIDELNRSEAKHFLFLFRDAGCQFRALYAYYPESEEIIKLYGTGPKQVTDRMFDKFFKYNSGGKCFSQVHTKHLTVTIDAFTIHNSLWQGKKVNLPSKRDMTLVI